MKVEEQFSVDQYDLKHGEISHTNKQSKQSTVTLLYHHQKQ